MTTQREVFIAQSDKGRLEESIDATEAGAAILSRLSVDRNG